MAHATQANARWGQLDGKRRGFITRCEKYAKLTLPKLCTPSGYTQESEELSHDYQSVGAQAVNHLANKLMLALFAPSRPFFRLDPSDKMKRELADANITEDALALELAQAEKRAVTALDRMAVRPKLYEAVKHLIVLGNVLLCFDKEDMRVIGLKRYVVRRSASGKLLELLIEDVIQFDELEPDVQQECWRQGLKRTEDHEVKLYRWIKRDANGDYRMSQHVDTIRLSKAFDGKWSERDLPYRPLTWDLSDDANYGTGLVEDYKGDFAGLSMLSTSQIQGAILSSEFRWLVNPAGMTSPRDFMDSENGAAIPGVPTDVQLIQSGKSADLEVVLNMSAEYINRIGRGFLLGSAVTRQAERVTAEEIRMQAQELETSLGGAYSRLAVDFQLPMAYWLMEIVDMSIKGTDIEPSIVTGLDALSRGGDLDEFKQFIGDVLQLNNLDPAILAKLNVDACIAVFAIARRINPTTYIKSEAQQQAELQQAQQQQQEQMAAQAGANAGEKIATQQVTG